MKFSALTFTLNDFDLDQFIKAFTLAQFGVVNNSRFPFADRDREWDSTAAVQRWREHVDAEDSPNPRYRQGFLWFENPGENFGDYKLPVVDIIDGEPHYVPRAIFAASGGRGVDAADIPDGDKRRVKNNICELYERMQEEFDDTDLECPFEE